ncbi:DNA polymerase III subunit delta [Butyricicoccus porcorum]|uniref:DNA polymerase III subunit delta n=1 Tax=Butyricicoccus porcorum TaxID=1945634 RepID=A0A252F1R8_9FIRM|nr:DNA polymerase III subunit delta [Butyricicoccus porcorum]MCI6926624.1 DNA polymerase III subunit delta [Butyricicoccus porcorum]MDD6986854.1 DNA polymerase III subunit delta [Butyricicoccus porcorum]MDY4483166.1 DNA polymerase III subunit delta [Butyricicoccus porcorum]OUM19746.1 DNA polymerase III subunit delta [Butyricicoccus porcorum]
MPKKPTKADGVQQLKTDLKNHTIGSLYLIGGEESYLKEHYLAALEKEVVDETFRDFNYDVFEGASLTVERLTEAVDSYPAMAERRMVVVRDLDVYKAPAAMKEELPGILSDLPAYVCLVFYYDTVALKPDKRTKLHSIITKNGCIADFSHLERHDLIPWVKRHAKDAGKVIDTDTCDYLLFLCGTSMTNLTLEIEKACAHSATDTVKRSDIDAVCTKVLDAVTFDLTDAITAQRFDRALGLVNDLIAQKNEPIVLLAAIARHIQRLYAAKLAMQAHKSDKELMELLGSKSTYYARKMRDSAARLDTKWLRRTLLLCGESDVAMKSAGADRQKVLELMLLQMAANFGEKAVRR